MKKSAKSFAVFGLGRFGGTIIKEFHKMGIEVIAVDKDEEKIKEYFGYATHAVRADAVNENTLNQIGVRNVDLAFVSFGDDIQASILTTLLLKEMGVSKVWAKAQNEYHSKVLEKIGVDRVIHPERDMAVRIAHHIVSDKMIDFIELSKDYSIAEIIVTKKLDHCDLSKLNARTKYGCTIVGIQRQGEFIVSPPADEVTFQNDILIVIGHNNNIANFEKEAF